MQRLILPLDNCLLNAGYKSDYYRNYWGFRHYGVDLTEGSKRTPVHACGNGIVHSCGLDGYSLKQGMGYAVVIVYQDVELRSGKRVNLACRMCHFDKLNVKKGQRVTPDTIIGWYGSTGRYASGPHLHIEFDTDTRYPAYAYGISNSGRVIKRGTVDSTVNPSDVWFVGNGQRYWSHDAWIKKGWCSQDDLNISKK